MNLTKEGIKQKYMVNPANKNFRGDKSYHNYCYFLLLLLAKKKLSVYFYFLNINLIRFIHELFFYPRTIVKFCLKSYRDQPRDRIISPTWPLPFVLHPTHTH